MNKWDEIREIIFDFRTLHPNWDDQDGSVPSDELIKSAIELLFQKEEKNYLLPPVRAVPTNSGGIIIEWQFHDTYLEVEIEEPYVGEWMQQDKDKEPLHYTEYWSISRSSLPE